MVREFFVWFKFILKFFLTSFTLVLAERKLSVECRNSYRYICSFERGAGDIRLCARITRTASVQFRTPRLF